MLINITGRLINGLFSGDRDKIRDFIAAFEKLRESLNNGAAIEILCVSTKALAMVEGAGEYMWLDLRLLNTYVQPQLKRRSLIASSR